MEARRAGFAHLKPRAGYVPSRPVLYRIWNAAAAGVLIFLLSPAFFVISIALLVTQGPDILYRAERLGKNRVPFTMNKFRTLKRGMEQMTPPEGLVVTAAVQTPLGPYLRATRLDELPQLFNVLKGDMNLMGPRPVRAETAARFSPALPGYERRFALAPGLVGYTQALMTHDTSKAIRQRFNAFLCRRPARLGTEILFLVRTGLSMADKILLVLADRLNLTLLGVRHGRRQHPRGRPRNAPVMITLDGAVVGCGYLLDINPETFAIVSPIPLRGSDFGFRILCFAGRRRRSASCVGHAEPARRPRPIGAFWRGDHCYLVHYRPTSALSHYIIDRYLLCNCVVLNVRPLRYLAAGIRLPRLVLARTALLGPLVALLIVLIALPNRGSGPTAGETYIRPFAPEAHWNVPVRRLVRHPASRALAHRLWTDAPSRPGDFNLSFDAYTFPVYDAREAVGEYPVVTLWPGNLADAIMPWHPTWQPAPGTDAQVIVVDPDFGREWNLFQASFDGRVVRAARANLVPGDYRTRSDGFPPSRGAGISYLAMLVRPAEIERGAVAHALSMPIRNVDGRYVVPPATKLERTHGRSGIPLGTRFALDVTPAQIEQWLASLPRELPASARRSAHVIAEALRDYGWIITDTSGGAHLQFEARVSAGTRWAALGLERVVIAGKEYPRDLLDGLIVPERIYALAPPDPAPARPSR